MGLYDDSNCNPSFLFLSKETINKMEGVRLD